jgi:hypothetical protein
MSFAVMLEPTVGKYHSRPNSPAWEHRDEVKSFMPKMMRETVEMSETMSKSWPEVCKHIRERGKRLTLETLDASDAFVKKMKMPDFYEGIDMKAEQFGSRMMASLAITNIGKPVVEYVVDRELSEALASTPFPTHWTTWRDAAVFPHTPMTLRFSDEQAHIFFTLGIVDDNLVVVNPQGSVAITPLSSTFDMEGRSPEEVRWARSVIGILMYITGNKDCVLTEREVQLTPPAAAYRVMGGVRPERSMTVINGVVGGKFVSALRAWEKTTEGGGDGTHASPKPHCRAGHWHIHWVGKKGEQTARSVFHHPCLVNAKEIGEVEIQRLVKAKEACTNF